MEVTDRQIKRAAAHFLAARRLRDHLREEPELRGLEACARIHIAKAATLASGFCGAVEREAQADVAMSAIQW